jgi:hypothetical protein
LKRRFRSGLCLGLPLVSNFGRSFSGDQISGRPHIKARRDYRQTKRTPCSVGEGAVIARRLVTGSRHRANLGSPRRRASNLHSNNLIRALSRAGFDGMFAPSLTWVGTHIILAGQSARYPFLAALSGFRMPRMARQECVPGGRVIAIERGRSKPTPSSVVWKPTNARKFYSVSLEKFTTWIEQLDSRSRKTSS